MSDLAQIGGSKVHCFLQRFSTCTARGPGFLSFKFNNLLNKHPPIANFFSKVFCRVKTNELEMNRYSKMENAVDGYAF